MDPAALAEADRFSQGAKFAEDIPPALRPLGAIGAAAGFGANELSKAVPGGQALAAKVAGALGGETSQFDTRGNSSPASFGNVAAGMKGYMAGGFPGLYEAIQALMARGK